MPRIFLAFCICCWVKTVACQINQPAVDSLTAVFNDKKSTQNQRVDALNELAWELAESDTAKSLDYARQALALAEKGAYHNGIGDAWNAMANTHSLSANYQQCLDFNLKALDLRKKHGEPLDVASTCSNLGNVFSDVGSFEKAIQYYHQAIEIAEKAKSDEDLALYYGNIANAKANMGDWQASLDFMLKSLKIKEQLGNKRSLAIGYGNLGTLHRIMGKHAEAEQWLLKAADIQRELKDTSQLARSLSNLSMAYRLQGKMAESEKANQQAMEMLKNGIDRVAYCSGLFNAGKLFREQGQPAKAAEQFQLCANLSQSINDTMAWTDCLVNLGDSQREQGKLAAAEPVLLQALELAKKTKSNETFNEVYQALAKLYAAKKDFAKAFEYQQLEYAYKDSLVNESSQKEIANLKVRYETEMKEREIEGLEKKTALQALTISAQRQRLLGLLGLLGVAALAGLLYFRLVKSRQQAALQAEALRQQKLRSEAVLQAEERERTRIARDLHDGVGQTMIAAKLNLQSLAEQFSGNLAQSDKLQNALELVDSSLKEVRNTAHNILPNTLLKQGLAEAAREFLNRLRSDRFQVQFEVFGLDERLDPTVENVLFRVMQEVVSNIVKHADATEVSIQIIRHDAEISLTVEDNGVGFDASNLENFEGIGLKNILSRAEFLGGTANFDSAVGRGTIVTVEVPLIKP
jgi:two-component system NarL family sensor kinase